MCQIQVGILSVLVDQIPLEDICHGKVERRRSSSNCLPSLIFPFMEQDY